MIDNPPGAKGSLIDGTLRIGIVLILDFTCVICRCHLSPQGYQISEGLQLKPLCILLARADLVPSLLGDGHERTPNCCGQD